MRPAAINRVVHLELHTADLQGARTFYEAQCGWPAQRVDTVHGAYLALQLDSGRAAERLLDGGIVECAIERPLWLPYVEVEEINAATEHARLLGAGVLLEPREGPAGWRSVVVTRAGGELALWQPKL